MNILVIARLLIAAVFILAGLAKLADLKGSRQAISSFGLPASVATPLGVLLPLTELAVAGALIPASTALWGALGALVLLLVFVVGIGANLARGRKPDCHCFGQLHPAPAGWMTLARNGVLAALAAFLVWQGWEGNVGPSAVAWIGALSTVQLLGLIGGVLVLGLLVGQWWFLLHLMSQNGRLLVRLEALENSPGSGVAPASQDGSPDRPAEGLPLGEKAPPFSLQGLHGETLTLDALRAAGKPIMLLFTDPGCGPCSALLPEIGRWQEEHANELSISLISRGTPEENRAKSEEHRLTNVLLQEDWEVSSSYQIGGTPSAVVVQPDGTIASPVAAGSEAIGTLVTQARSGEPIRFPAQPTAPAPQGEPCPNCGKVHPNGDAAPTMAAGPKVGESAPPLKLPDLKGKNINLAGFKGSETLVLFWNPGCGFCQQMLPDLKEWEATSPEDAPKVLVVSGGSEAANREMGLTSPVLLDQQFAVGRAFGASGTPSAVLVDAEGKVASEVTVGAPAVMELAGAGKTT
jgi:methylamine dehydrogenase accessory protein MauD